MFGGLAGTGRQLAGLPGIVRALPDSGRNLLQAGRGLLQAGRLLLRATGDLPAPTPPAPGEEEFEFAALSATSSKVARSFSTAVFKEAAICPTSSLVRTSTVRCKIAGG